MGYLDKNGKDDGRIPQIGDLVTTCLLSNCGHQFCEHKSPACEKIWYVTFVEYNEEFQGHYCLHVEDENGNCAICGCKDEFGKQLAVDHNHQTGQVRALLCTACNQAIGRFNEDPERFRKAAEYLERYRNVSSTISS